MKTDLGWRRVRRAAAAAAGSDRCARAQRSGRRLLMLASTAVAVATMTADAMWANLVA